MSSCHALSYTDKHIQVSACPAPRQCAIDRHPFFRDLPAQDLASLCSKSRSLTVDSGQMVFRQGERAQRFYYVVSGRIKLYRVSGSGAERILGSVGEGGLVGEAAIWSPGGLHTCYAQPLENTELLGFGALAMREVLSRHPDYALSLLHYLSGNIDSWMDDMEILTSQSARERVVRFFLKHIHQENGRCAELDLPLPKCQVASQLAMQPETFSRILHELKTRQIVEVQRSHIVIHDLQALKAFVQ